jgi:outer membrane protein assembly factor BamD (BamD/ComL family)
VKKRRRWRRLGVLAGLLVAAAGVAVWVAARRLPVREAHQFFTAPVEVGEKPPAPPAAPAAGEEVSRRFRAAKKSFRAGDYRAAAKDFAFVVQQDPAGPEAGEAQWNLTRSRLRSGDGSGALQALDVLIKHYAGYLGEEAPLLRKGLDRMEEGKLSEAEDDFEGTIEAQPDSEFVPLSYAMIARIHWPHGEPMETVKAFARMFASVKDDVPAYSVLAKQLDRYARGDEGVTETFGELAKEAPEGFRDIYQYLEARSLLEHDQFQATHDALEELRRRYPDGDFTHIVDLEHAWNLLRNKQPGRALEIFERLEKSPPPADKAAFDAFFDLRAELPLGIARCHLALGQYAEAAAAFERAIQEHPASIYAVEDRLGLARAYEGMGQYEQAADVMREVIEQHPDEPKLWAMKQQLARIEQHLAKAPQ